MDLPSDNEDWLMERAASGDTQAFDQIVRIHQHRVQRFAIRMLNGDNARGADIAVTALLKLWECRHSYRPCGMLGAWLLRVTHRLCLDTIQQSRASSPASDAKEAATDNDYQLLFEESELSQAVRTAISDLPEAQRSVLILSVYEGLTYDEISEALDISPGTVASRKNLAIGVLRRRLAAWETR